jgi:cytoplasmic iron level regulating protein YaaA (DUF328/UPF0246 family)
MLLLLPPSETKRDGGTAGALALESLSFPSLLASRLAALTALEAMAADDDAAARALKLSAKAAPAELTRNREVRTSATQPAIERYTGVLFDALDVASLSRAARRRASSHVVVHSALFGLLRADDLIPAYRLSCDSQLPDVPLRAVWRDPISAVLAEQSEIIVDLRSSGYAALGPLPVSPRAVGVSVVAIGDDGVARALNHFNKKGKGEWVRELLLAGPLPTSIDALCRRSVELGWPLRRSGERMLELTVPGTLPPRASTP